MNAMIFAAGLGTRLKPLTDTMPKALVRVNGKPLLQHVLDKLQAAGFDDIVINVHHHADQIKEFVKSYGASLPCSAAPRPSLTISDETAQLLDTGGGLKKALPLFASPEPVLIHNVDILSNVDLRDFYSKAADNDVTLLVSERKTSRYLLFDNDMRLVGWTNIQTGEVRSPYENLNPADCRMYAFSGIHCVARNIGKEMQSWPDRFAIMDFYIASCARMNIKGVVAEDLQLMDVGKLDTLSEAEQFINKIIQH